MKRILPGSLLLIIIFSNVLFSTSNAIAQTKPSLQVVASKNYFLLSLLDSSAALQKLFSEDAVLKSIASKRADSLAARAKACGRARACFVDLMRFSEEDISDAGARIHELWKKGNALDLLFTKKLLSSGAYAFDTTDTAEYLRKAFEQDAHGINFAIEVYGNGRRPNYPNIDSIDFKVRDLRDTALYHPSLYQLIYNSTYILDAKNQRQRSFYSVPLDYALLLLDINERDQAADYEPMQNGINKAAVKAIKTTKWSAYPYTVIVVPGAGPDEYGIALSAEGKLRCRLAAEYYHQKKAPFLIVSGGKVHPFKTPYNEAVEIKKYMVEQLAIPESAVIAEPHARHTTTNMRNAVRLMFKYGVPTDLPGIVSTTRGQSAMVANTLAARCEKEIGYSPFKPGKILSESLTEFYALKSAFRIDPEEPMDP